MSARGPARFYKAATIAECGGAFQVQLDGKPIKTPQRNLLALPTRELADAVAAEWNAQSGTLEPATMPMTRLSYAALDVVRLNRGRIVHEIVSFGRTDLLCYRAEAPAKLVARQAEAWDPLLAWSAATLGARLAVGSGIVHVAQPEAAVAALARAVEACDDFALTGLHSAASVSGSLVLALALKQGRLSAAEAFRLSRLDEEFQAETWGRDAEAEMRAERLSQDLAAAAQFLNFTRS